MPAPQEVPPEFRHEVVLPPAEAVKASDPLQPDQSTMRKQEENFIWVVAAVVLSVYVSLAVLYGVMAGLLYFFFGIRLTDEVFVGVLLGLGVPILLVTLVMIGGAAGVPWLKPVTARAVEIARSFANWRWVLVVVLFALFAVFIWPTPYAYYEGPGKRVLIRVNRFTGKAEYVIPQQPQTQARTQPLTREEREAITQSQKYEPSWKLWLRDLEERSRAAKEAYQRELRSSGQQDDRASQEGETRGAKPTP